MRARGVREKYIENVVCRPNFERTIGLKDWRSQLGCGWIGIPCKSDPRPKYNNKDTNQ